VHSATQCLLSSFTSKLLYVVIKRREVHSNVFADTISGNMIYSMVHYYSFALKRDVLFKLVKLKQLKITLNIIIMLSLRYNNFLP